MPYAVGTKWRMSHLSHGVKQFSLSPRVGDKLIATGKWGFTLLEGIFSLFPPSVVLLFDVMGCIFLCNEASHFCPT